MKQKKHNFGISPVISVYNALKDMATCEGLSVKAQAVECIKMNLIRKGYLKQK